MARIVHMIPSRPWDASVRVEVRPHKTDYKCTWSAPEPIVVRGLRFSQPTVFRAVYIGRDCVATDNRELVDVYPHLQLLEGPYTEWRASGEFSVAPFLQLLVELVTVYTETGWVEPIYEYTADIQQRLNTEARRKQKIADCFQTLSASAPKRFGEQPSQRKR